MNNVAKLIQKVVGVKLRKKRKKYSTSISGHFIKQVK